MMSAAKQSRLSRAQIAGFFFVGYFLLPLSPLWFVISAFYQLCLVQGKLSSQAKVITAVVCNFFIVGWIPFVNIGVWLSLDPTTRQSISILINGTAPLAMLTIFYVWGSVIGYRYYTIEDSYEQERDRTSVRKLKKQELNPPLAIARSIETAARGEESEEHPITSLEAPYGTPGGGDSSGFGSPSSSPARDASFTGSPTSGGGGGGGSKDTHHQHFHLSPAAAGTPSAAADNNSNNNSNMGLLQRRDTNMNDIADSAADHADQMADKVLVRNAFDLYCLLKEESGRGANLTITVGFILAAATIGTARIYEWQNPSTPPDSPLYMYQPLYTLSTIFLASIFFIFYTTLAFVHFLYKQNIELVRHLTYMGRASGDLRADRDLAGGGDDSDTDDDGTNNTGGEFGGGSGSNRSQSMHYISATAFSTYESTAAGGSGTGGVGGGAGGVSSIHSAEAGKYLSNNAAKAVIVELLDPYNMTHLRAWEEVRKIAADQISSSTSVLNSFFTPTVFISAFGLFGLLLYISIRVFFVPNSDPSGPFFIAALALAFVLFLYLLIIYVNARETRRHFKAHETVVSRIAFDVARELEHSVRHSDSQGGIDERSSRAMNNNNNNSASPHHGGGGGSLNGTPHELPNAVLTGGAGARHQQSLHHEPPTSVAELSSLFDSVNSLCNMMSVATPRPLFIGMEQRNVRYFLAYVFAISAILLFFALLTSMRKGRCQDNIIPNTNATDSGNEGGSGSMMFRFFAN